MIFFGWGNKQIVAPFDAATQLVLRYRYFHLMWLFRISFDLKHWWVFAGPQGPTQRPLTPQEMEYYKVKERLPINLWWHYGLLIIPILIVVGPLFALIVGALASL